MAFLVIIQTLPINSPTPKSHKSLYIRQNHYQNYQTQPLKYTVYKKTSDKMFLWNIWLWNILILNHSSSKQNEKAANLFAEILFDLLDNVSFSDPLSYNNGNHTVNVTYLQDQVWFVQKYLVDELYLCFDIHSLNTIIWSPISMLNFAVDFRTML